MNRVVRIFMKRDDMTREEAVERFNELQEEVMETLQTGGRMMILKCSITQIKSLLYKLYRAGF